MRKRSILSRQRGSNPAPPLAGVQQPVGQCCLAVRQRADADHIRWRKSAGLEQAWLVAWQAGLCSLTSRNLGTE